MNHINDEQWNEMVDLLDEDFVELIQDYLKDSSMRIENLKQAQEEGDNTLGLNEAHTLKGASANIGADLLAKHCFSMQSICHANLIADAHNVLQDIELEFIELSKIIKQRLLQMY